MKRTDGNRFVFALVCVFGFGLLGTCVDAQIAGPLAGQPENGSKPTRIRVSARVARTTIQMPPIYPQAAIDQKIEGNVVLHLIIAKDGSVKDLTVVSGAALLSDSAVDSVKQWRYQPVRLNGDPVEVDTTVTLNYVIGPPAIVLVNDQPLTESSPAALGRAEQQSVPVSAQQASADSPATDEDVERYLEAVHSHDMMKQMMEQMSKPLHQMVHEQFEKDKDKLPADFETHLNQMVDEMLNAVPVDEMMQAMVPVYRKHFTKGDIDALIAFYSAPTGQKMLKEMPAIMAETMRVTMPLMQKQMAAMTERLQQDIAKSMEEARRKVSQDPPVTRN